MPNFMIIGLLVLYEKILKVFTIYGRGSHLGSVTWTIYIYFLSAFPRRLHIKFGFDWPSGFREKSLKLVVIYLYIAPGQGQTTPRVNVFH